ncbi:MAG: glycoside hydrolase family 3 protein [Oscillospiraceae bacterium]|nr:glycoside hydrolase family 3 protein [Oscillospiraceae bacterium]
MKKLILIFLAALMLAGCAAPAVQETTAPPTETAEVPTVATTAPPVTTEAPPETTLSPEAMDSMLADMTLRQKVGQLFIVRLEQLLPGTGTVQEVTPELEQALEEYPMGGVILFGDNVMKPEQLLTLNEGLANLSGIPLFIAVDEEGGLVARLANNWKFKLTKYGSAMAVGSSGDPADALEMGRTIGGYLSEYGFNLDFAPVADVHTNPKNPVIGTRAFSTDPVIAAQMVDAFRDGLEENDIIATFKHFPGHGDTAEDSHSGLAVVYKTREELENCEFIPFREATSQDMVMVAHVALPNVTGDMTPATLSQQIVTGILKEELGFEGLIITDAMEMGAIVETYGSGNAAVAALKAGCHIILIPEDLPEAFDAVLAALEDGSLTMEWLDETVRKILEFKQLHGIL